MKKNWSYLAAVAALTITTVACGETNNAVGENRPDAAAVNRAAGTSNTSESREINPNGREAAGSAGQAADRAGERTGEAAGTAGAAAGRAAERTGDAAGNAADSAGRTMDRAGDRAGDAAGAAGNTVSNAALTTKVKAKFAADDVVKARVIEVDSKDGVVTLSGTVTSKMESDKAEQLARQTEDVKRVVNNLKVGAAR